MPDATSNKTARPVLNFGAINFYTDDTSLDQSYDNLSKGSRFTFPPIKPSEYDFAGNCLQRNSPNTDR